MTTPSCPIVLDSRLQAQDLVFGTGAHGELEANTTTSQLSINLSIGVEPVVYTTPLLLVQDSLQYLASIFLGSDALANNFDRVNNIRENGIVDRG